MKISFILVHYHTPGLLERSVQAINREMSGSAHDSEIIVIDNGSRPEDAQLLKSLPVYLIDPGSNLGYAGGVNLGVKNSTGDIFILMNPDVELLPGCAAALVTALSQGYSAAGPRFYLDPGKQVLLPPLIELSKKNEILWRLSALGEGMAKRARQSWREHARAQWLASSTVQNYDLTGALLAVTRRAWETVGPFDEIFKLYFEELDWLMRLRLKGLSACFVPTAEAVHKVSQSASAESRSKKWYQESLAIYRRRYYGRVFTYFLEKAVPVLRAVLNLGDTKPKGNSVKGNPELDLTHIQGPLFVEISDTQLGIPAMCIPVPESEPGKWRFSDDSWSGLEPGVYTLRLTDSLGHELKSLSFKR